MWPRLLLGPPESMTENQQVCPRAQVCRSCGRRLGQPRWSRRGTPRGRAFQAEPLPSGTRGHRASCDTCCKVSLPGNGERLRMCCLEFS